MKDLKKFVQDERGIGTVEMILILVVLIALVLIFKEQLTDLVNSILTKSADRAVRYDREQLFGTGCHHKKP